MGEQPAPATKPKAHRRRRLLLPPFVIPENLAINLLAITVGIVTAFATALFILVMRWTHYLFFDVIHANLSEFIGSAAIVAIPVLGGLLVGPIVTYICPEARGSGVPQLMHAISTIKGKMRLRTVFLKMVAAGLTLSSGGSAGREGPIIQIGGGIGSFIATLFRQTPGRTRWLIASGCAAGISVLFNTPIAGTIFAMEVIVGDYAKRSFASIIFAAVSGTAVGYFLLGPSPSFLIPKYTALRWGEYGFFIVLGVLAAVIGLLFVKLLYWTEGVFTRWQIPAWLKPALGGLGVGLIALGMPQIMGTGYDFINAMLKEEFTLRYLALFFIALMAFKIAATSLTVGSGGSGGVFAPSVFIGGTLGASIGHFASYAMGGLDANPGAYALVGMAAVLGAVVQAPFTAILMIMEMTGDYALVIPLMLAVMTSTLIYHHFLPYSAFTLKLKQMGVRHRFHQDVNVLEEIAVADVMHHGVETISEDLPYEEAHHIVFSSHHNGFPVVDKQGLLVGMVTEGDFGGRLITRPEHTKEIRVRDIMCSSVKSVYPDMPVWEVHKLFEETKIGRFPVVSREDARRIVGIVTRSDLIHAYPIALERHEIEFEI